jgi:hypothetical protein
VGIHATAPRHSDLEIDYSTTDSVLRRFESDIYLFTGINQDYDAIVSFEAYQATVPKAMP